MSSARAGRLSHDRWTTTGAPVTGGSFDIPATVTTVTADGTRVQIGAGSAAPARLRHVGVLATLALAARRQGGRLQVADAADDLLDLIALSGLGEVLGVQPRRQAELLEDRRADEVVQSGDLPL
jgi:hypothetical protein